MRRSDNTTLEEKKEIENIRERNRVIYELVLSFYIERTIKRC